LCSAIARDAFVGDACDGLERRSRHRRVEALARLAAASRAHAAPSPLSSPNNERRTLQTRRTAMT